MKGKYLLLGSNLGNKSENIARAITLIKTEIGRVKKASSLYLTSPWGTRDQPDYYNQVILIDTILEPAILLESVLEIERSMGRIRNKKWESRIIDIDILFYDNLILKEESLVIPHPEIQSRKFTLVPMVEIAPDEIHPVTGLTITKMLELSTDTESVIKLGRK